MWRQKLNFVSLHYVYITFMGLLSFAILYPYGNISAIDAYFFGASSSTGSGLNTVDLKELKTYQQLYLYFVPMFTNLGFVTIIVVVVRLFWFRRKLKNAAPILLQRNRRLNHESKDDLELGSKILPTETPEQRPVPTRTVTDNAAVAVEQLPRIEARSHTEPAPDHGHLSQSEMSETEPAIEEEKVLEKVGSGARITFDPSTNLHPKRDTALYIPGPRDREEGKETIEQVARVNSTPVPGLRRRLTSGSRLAETRSMERVVTVASSMFVIGSTREPQKERSLTRTSTIAAGDFPQLSREVTIGRNSLFHNLSSKDREELGGIEYQSLKLLLKIVLIYFFGLHLIGVICLITWIQYANPKYTNYIAECGQDKIWWAIYSAQTMTDNLGFTLTPDSMISFNDVPAPMLIMSFLTLAGHTCYPIVLRLVLWTISKLAPRQPSIREPLSFLLNHPRRCYTLLFPSGPTWALFGILLTLNIIDILLIILLDLDNDAVASLPVGKRVAAAIFQSASSRHTGTTSFNLADVNPAVQMSLLVMMYISVYPIAIAIRSSNTYEERSLGLYEADRQPTEEKGGSYFVTHLRNQLSFDLWYICLGIFCICIAESNRIMDANDPAFNVWPVLFEVVSAYGNVGLSLGYPTVSTSFSSQFSTFSKLVVCAMMLRGRHRGLPYALDRAIVLPNERSLGIDATAAGGDHEHRE
ncbi:cation transport protein-domain-containing protein [Fusarium redolens]|uniref:Cation transport protein-domain-containing protein n=1 Tax=Fusarium redolens TaxID=48865 RepID=A0A9P9G455_FUSRE|nr:cation transport protein-domain-containing protein [Fusarium redolens]KAH7231692.1 cation transport protein-domain-containing protein [Fusarium redolens]